MMDKWMILRESEYIPTVFPPSCTKKRNYGCFKYFRKNIPTLLRSLTASNERPAGGGYQKMASGTCCSKLLLHTKKGHQNKVILYAEESWATSAANTYWVITPSYWRRNGCNIEEYCGYRK